MDASKEFEDAFNEATGGQSESDVLDQRIEQEEDPQKLDAPEPAQAEAQPGGEPNASENPPSSQQEGEPKPSTQAEESLESLKRKLAEIEHRERSASGRIGAFQKRINELESQINSKQNEVIRALTSADDKEFRENYPEIAAAMDAKVSSVAAAVQQQVQQAIQPLKQAEESRILEQQFAALEAAHPAWQQTVASPDFKSWLQVQPEPVKTLANSREAADAAALINFYKAMRPQTEPRTSAAPKNELQEKRERQLAQSSGIPARNKPSVTSSIPNDFDAAFNAFVNADPRFK